jgi:nucleoside diphosphate kinase
MKNIESIGDKNVEKILDVSDISYDSDSGLAMVVIKPDAFSRREDIVNRIKADGLGVLTRREKRLPDNFVAGVLYKDLPADIEEETLRHFNSGQSELLLIQGGPDLVEKLVRLTGQDTNPSNCSSESIRSIFGEHFPRKTDIGNDYYRNAIHRPKNKEERRAGLDDVGSLFV